MSDVRLCEVDEGGMILRCFWGASELIDGKQIREAPEPWAVDGAAYETAQADFEAAGRLDQKRTIIDSERDAARYAPVNYLGHRFQADAASLWLLTFQVNDLNAGGVLDPDFAWWDIDNVRVPMKADDLRALHHLVRDRNYGVMKTARAAKDEALAIEVRTEKSIP